MELLDEVNAFLNYTWPDTDRDARTQTYIDSSVAYLEEIAGKTLDFTTDHLAKDLLLNRVLYMNSQALDDFSTNYAGLIKELSIKYLVDDQQEQA